MLAVNTAGMLVRRSVWEALGGLDEQLPCSATTSTSAGAPPWPGTARWSSCRPWSSMPRPRTEGSEDGVTGRHTHHEERRAPSSPRWPTSRRALRRSSTSGSSSAVLRVVGFLAVRSVGEALDELAAGAVGARRPAGVWRPAPAAGRWAGHRRPRRACWPRPGCPTATASTSSPTWPPQRPTRPPTSPSGAVSPVRRDARRTGAGTQGRSGRGRRGGLPRRHRHGRPLLHQPGRRDGWCSSGCWRSSPTTRASARSPAARCRRSPDALGDWWRLHTQAWHPLGTGTDAPAPPTCCPALTVGPPARHTPARWCPDLCCWPPPRGAPGGCSRSWGTSRPAGCQPLAGGGGRLPTPWSRRLRGPGPRDASAPRGGRRGPAGACRPGLRRPRP